MNSLLTIIRFTIRNRVRSRSFLVTTILFVILIAVGVNLPHLVSSVMGEGTAAKVGMFQTDSEVPNLLKTYYSSQEKPEVEIVEYPAQAEGEPTDSFIKEKVEAGEVKGFLLLENEDPAGFKAVYRSHDSVMGSGTQSKLMEGLQNVKTQLAIRDAGLTGEQLATLNAPVTLNAEMLSQGDGGTGGTEDNKSVEEVAAAYVLVNVLFILMFMVNSFYGNMITMEITAEKSSRVMEILITSVSPVKQMFGKVIGMFLLGLGQTILFIAVGLANLAVPANREYFLEQDLDFGVIPPSLYVYFILFFILGFFLYAMIYAAIGSIVSRTEEIGQATMPVMLLLLAGFYIGIFSMNDPSSLLIRICSYVPFFSPSIMFLRIGMTGVPFWEIALSLAVLLGTAILLGWLAAKIYRTGVLMYGKRPSWKEVRKAMKAYQA